MYDWDFIVSDDFMGMTKIKVKDIKLNKVFSLPLYDRNMNKDEKYKGTLSLKFEEII